MDLMKMSEAEIFEERNRMLRELKECNDGIHQFDGTRAGDMFKDIFCDLQTEYNDFLNEISKEV